MTPEQIDAVTNGLISLEHAVDTYGPSLAVIAASTCALWGAGRLIDRAAARRALRRTPAAPDNLPPCDDDALTTCQHIDRLGVRDPDMPRLVNNYLRDRQRKEDTP
jgi:hypothetical protein